MTYREILERVPVAKSTLSDWLGSVGLAKVQKQRLTKKRREGALRGAARRREIRLQQIHDLTQDARVRVGKISARELWLIAVALYWAEGSKQSDHNVSTGIMLGNSDPRMLKLFRAWLKQAGVSDTSMIYELYVHEDRRADTESFKTWWAHEIGVPRRSLNRVYFKRGNPKTNRTNVGDLYHGLLRIKVSISTNLNRQMSAWASAISENLGDGVIGNTSAFGAEDSRFDP